MREHKDLLGTLWFQRFPYRFVQQGKCQRGHLKHLEFAISFLMRRYKAQASCPSGQKVRCAAWHSALIEVTTRR